MGPRRTKDTGLAVRDGLAQATRSELQTRWRPFGDPWISGRSAARLRASGYALAGVSFPQGLANGELHAR
jgi:hypothetical protein